MKVFCILDCDDSGCFLCSIWSTEELAWAEMDRKGWRNDKYHVVEPWFIDHMPLGRKGREG